MIPITNCRPLAHPTRQLTPDIILDVLMAYFQPIHEEHQRGRSDIAKTAVIDRKAVFSPNRAKYIVMVRSFLVWLCYRQLRMSDGEIGEYLGRDRTTAIYHRQLVWTQLHTRWDNEYKHHISELEKLLR